jgi:cystathionine beta-lyase/cystathionine gamma-synthase
MGQTGKGTRAVHGDGGPRDGALAEPIVLASTFAFPSAEDLRRHLAGADDGRFLYTRYANPTLRALEQALAAMQGTEAALVLSSGMAAMTTAILSRARAGDEVLAAASLYGGTVRLLRDFLSTLGIGGRLLRLAELAQIDRQAGPRSRVLIVESPTNPTLDVVDLRQVAASARRAGVGLIVDNTFATPFLQRPSELGADLVVESLTKAIGGHSDLTGGMIAGSKKAIEDCRALMKLLGGCLDPHSAFLAQRGLKTLHLRVERQCQNALALARHLEGHPKLERVLYPGLPSHPGHDLARSQMSAFGGIVSLVVRGGLPAAERFFDATRLFARAASLGGVESLVSLSVHTSHAGYSAEELREAGVDPGNVRLSLGVEDSEDLIADVEQALDTI